MAMLRAKIEPLHFADVGHLEISLIVTGHTSMQVLKDR